MSLLHKDFWLTAQFSAMAIFDRFFNLIGYAAFLEAGFFNFRRTTPLVLFNTGL